VAGRFSFFGGGIVAAGTIFRNPKKVYDIRIDPADKCRTINPSSERHNEQRNATMKTNTKRAAKGGEVGANGEWYEGGKFINTIPENRKKEGSKPRTTGKREVAPYVWIVPPTDCSGISLYRQFAGAWGRIENGVAIFDNRVDVKHVTKFFGHTIESAQAILDRWNAGERWM
jgi:hypothetical protein